MINYKSILSFDITQRLIPNFSTRLTASAVEAETLGATRWHGPAVTRSLSSLQLMNASKDANCLTMRWDFKMAQF